MLTQLIWIGILSGWLSGILVNYLADVLPVTRRFSQPICKHCDTEINWKDYFFWRSCRHCQAHPSFRNILVQIIFLFGSAYFWLYPSDRVGFWVGMLLLIYFGVVVVIDIEHRLVLHPVSIAGSVICLFLGWNYHGFLRTISGGLLGFSAMFLLYLLGEQYIKWMARRKGQAIDEVALGFGDVILAGVLGLILGFPAIIVSLIGAILAGGLTSLLYLLILVITKNYKPFQAIPYAPFLVLGAFILLFF
jgi:leader peptidase (prepilin peptidase) / N-methyltransferase